VRLRIADRKEFSAGLIFTAIGLVALGLSFEYRLGTATRMGPGFFPLCLSVLLIVLGIAAAVRGLRASMVEPLGRWPLVPLVFVMCGVIAFGLLIDWKGLAVAVLVLIVLACYQRLRSRPLEVALIAALLIAMTVGLFIYGLGMPFYLYR